MTEPGAALRPALHGLVLAGGRSQRLGRDKASVLYQGETLLARAVRMLAAVAREVRVAVRPDQAADLQRRGFAIVLDACDGVGPAAGIVAAHRLAPDVAWLALACDMPRVTPAMLATLVAQRDPGRSAIAFRAADGLPEPLCAIYEPATLARFRRQVEAGGDPGPRHWLAGVAPVLLDAPEPGALSSINTPQDLERLGGPLQGGQVAGGNTQE